MKKLIAITSAALLGLGLTACSAPASTEAPPPIPAPSASSSSSQAPVSSQPAAASSSSVSSSTPRPAKAGEGTSIEGSWVTGTISFEDMSFTPAELEEKLNQAASIAGGMEEQLSALELIKTLSMTFEAGGKGTLTVTLQGKETSMPFTWEGQNGSYTLDDGTNPPTTLVHYEDNTLSYTYGGFELLLIPA